MNNAIRWRVLNRDAFTCQYCGRSAPHVVLQVDHVEPRRWGGADDLDNLVTSCWRCNQGKKDRDGRDGLSEKNANEYALSAGRAQSMLDVLVNAYAAEIDCTPGDVWEWLDGEVS